MFQTETVQTHAQSLRVPLYEEVAERLTHLIERGTYAPGARIPSVRQLSQQLQVSVSTVIGAYGLLEDQGRIEARPQSGYYVRRHSPHLPARGKPLSEPETSRPAPGPMPVNIGQLTMRIMRHHHDPSLVPLGAAIPNPALLPLEKLNRTMSKVMRQLGDQGHVYDAPPGCETLRVQVARRLMLAGCTLTPDEIVTTTGSQEAVSLCLRALCQPGDTVAIESPIYYGVLQAIEMQGLKALEIPTHPRTRNQSEGAGTGAGPEQSQGVRGHSELQQSHRQPDARREQAEAGGFAGRALHSSD